MDGKPDLRGSCLEADPNGNFPPLPYLLPAAALSVSHDATTRPLAQPCGDRRCRRSASCSWRSRCCGTGSGWSLLGLLAATTPMVLFISSVMNSSGPADHGLPCLRRRRDPDHPCTRPRATVGVGGIRGERRSRDPRRTDRPRVRRHESGGGWRPSLASRYPCRTRRGSATVASHRRRHVAGGRCDLARLFAHRGLRTDLRDIAAARQPSPGHRSASPGTATTRSERSVPDRAAAPDRLLDLVGAGSRHGGGGDGGGHPARAGVRCRPHVLALAFPVLFYAWVDRFTGFGLQGREVLPALMLIPLVAGEIISRHRAVIAHRVMGETSARRHDRADRRLPGLRVVVRRRPSCREPADA